MAAETISAGDNKQLQEMRRRLPLVSYRTIFDVGANVGTTSQKYSVEFPSARIFAFEPVRSTFRQLQETAAALSNVTCFNLAMGDTATTAVMSAIPNSPSNKIVDADRKAEKGGVETVEVLTGDQFCAAHGVESIDFIKIDAEGFDLKVCIGFAGMLKAQTIDLLQVEAGMNSRNERHVPLEAFKSYLEPLGYFIFKIYDQAFERRAPQARRCNAVFISDRCIRRHSDAGWRK